jgi:hypothetical protein
MLKIDVADRIIEMSLLKESQQNNVKSYKDNDIKYRMLLILILHTGKPHDFVNQMPATLPCVCDNKPKKHLPYDIGSKDAHSIAIEEIHYKYD